MPSPEEKPSDSNQQEDVIKVHLTFTEILLTLKIISRKIDVF